MRYALLICTEEANHASMTSSEMNGYAAFQEEMGARGVLQGGRAPAADLGRDHRARA